MIIVTHCPVCGMDTADSDICAEHSGINYHFCMPQCRENFLARPLLYRGNQSAKLAGRKIIKRRSFALDYSVSSFQRETLFMALNKLMSVCNITVTDDKVSIDYDLLEITAEQIEAALVQAGALMGAGWGDRLKRGWIYYIEENELDNLAATETACCNKSPV